MPRRYAFELFYPAARVVDGLRAMARRLPALRRGRPSAEFDAEAVLRPLMPDAPVFFHTALLFPADEHVRAFRADWEDRDSEWDNAGNEYLPVGSIEVAVRTGARYALVTFAAVTGGMSDVFERSYPVRAACLNEPRAQGSGPFAPQRAKGPLPCARGSFKPLQSS